MTVITKESDLLDPISTEIPGVLVLEPPKPDVVNHPRHYGTADDPYEAIKVIEAWDLNFNLGNAVKYIRRSGRKEPTKLVQDLEKARWYLDREIQNLTKWRRDQAEEDAGKMKLEPEETTKLIADIAAALAHRACCGSEHDPQNGKLHGYCVVCGVEWPCETAQYFLRKPQS